MLLTNRNTDKLYIQRVQTILEVPLDQEILPYAQKWKSSVTEVTTAQINWLKYIDQISVFTGFLVDCMHKKNGVQTKDQQGFKSF